MGLVFFSVGCNANTTTTTKNISKQTPITIITLSWSVLVTLGLGGFFKSILGTVLGSD
jgi:hypothetical protein